MPPALVLFPAILCRFQSETGLALVYFSFFLVMYREGLPGAVLVIGFSLAALVVATLLLEPDTLAIILTVIAVITIYVLRKQIKKKRRIFFMIAGFWILCVGVQRFAVPFFFDHVLEPYQVKRIYDAIGRDYVPKNQAQAELVLKEEESKSRKSQEAGNYNVRQSKIAIGSGGLFGKGLLKGTQTRYGFVPEQRTDFIFDTIGEGFGFVGSFIFLSLYLVLLLRIVTVAERQRSTFSRCLCIWSSRCYLLPYYHQCGHDHRSRSCNWYSTSFCELWGHFIPDFFSHAFYSGKTRCRQAHGIEVGHLIASHPHSCITFAFFHDPNNNPAMGMTIIPLSEGTFTIDKSKLFVPFDLGNDDLQKRPIGSLLVEVQPFVVITSRDILLLDTGLGFSNDDGILQIHQNLVDNGISPLDITKVLVSHLHKDHAGGISLADPILGNRHLSFPHAIYYLQRQELNFAFQKGLPSYIPSEFELLKSTANVEFVEEQWYD